MGRDMKFVKNIFIALSLVLGSAAAVSAEEDAIYTGLLSSEAVSGYDTVAYFTEGKAVKGSDEFSTKYMGAEWLFSSKKNLELFKKDPAKYAPQYGGYCAWAVGHGYTASGDPEAWKIVDNKLYLNYNKHVQGRWSEDIPTYIKDGDKNYPGLVDLKSAK